MTDGVICDRCEEAVESKKHKRGLRMTAESEVNSKAATSYQSAEFDLCEDCSHEFHEWADIRKPRGYRDGEEDAAEDDEDSGRTFDTSDSGGAVVEWEGFQFYLALSESFLDMDEHGTPNYAEFAGYVEGVEEVDDE